MDPHGDPTLTESNAQRSGDQGRRVDGTPASERKHAQGAWADGNTCPSKRERRDVGKHV